MNMNGRTFKNKSVMIIRRKAVGNKNKSRSELANCGPFLVSYSF